MLQPLSLTLVEERGKSIRWQVQGLGEERSKLMTEFLNLREIPQEGLFETRDQRLIGPLQMGLKASAFYPTCRMKRHHIPGLVPTISEIQDHQAAR